MSDLEFPIFVLEKTGSKISNALQLTGVDQPQQVNQLAGITEAITLLKTEIKRREDESDEIEKIKEKEEKEEDKNKKGKDHLDYE